MLRYLNCQINKYTTNRAKSKITRYKEHIKNTISTFELHLHTQDHKTFTNYIELLHYINISNKLNIMEIYEINKHKIQINSIINDYTDF